MRVCGLNKSYGKQEIFKDFSLAKIQKLYYDEI